VPVPCPRCAAPLDLPALFAGISYRRGPGVLTGICPACGEGLELRVRGGVIEFGYTYWAGSMHFECMFSHAVPGLRRVDSGGTISVELGGVSYPARETG
jgi:hypothetical protein